jgi:transposase
MTGAASGQRLAATIETWWEAIEAFLRTGITNAKSEAIDQLSNSLPATLTASAIRRTKRLRTRSLTSKVTVPG